MAAPTNTVDTFSAIGNREDLADVIYDISPGETPFLSAAPRSRATSIQHDWQTQSIASAASNAAVEGDDATADAHIATTRLTSDVQISSKTISVSGTQRKVDSAGRADEFSWQLAMRGKELKLDMEFALTRIQLNSSGGAATARATAGLENWLATNKTSVGTGTAQTTIGWTAGGVVAVPTDSTVQGALTKAALDDVIQKCWTQGGNPSVIQCGPANRTNISGFTGISTLQTPASPTMNVTLMGAVDFYKSNFGTLKVVPSRVQRDRTVFVLDMEMLGTAMLRDIHTQALAKTGDADRMSLVSEYCLVVKNELASGKVTDCTT